MKLWSKKSKSEPDQRRRPGDLSTNKARAFSYYQNRGDSGRQNRDVDAALGVGSRRVSKRKVLLNLPYYVALAVIIGSVLFTLSLSSQVNVVVVNDENRATDAVLRSHPEYETAISNLVGQSIFNFTKVTIGTEEIEQGILDEFSEVTHAAVAVPIVGRKPVVYIRIAEPRFLLESQNENYVIDEQGRAVISLADMNDKSEALELPKVIDQSNLQVEIGQQIVPKEQITFMAEVVNQLSAAEYAIDRLLLPPLANELHVEFKELDYFAKFTFVNDPKLQVGTFIATKKQLERTNQTPNSYIDVRVEERSYYR